jgi:predicted acetyltransferase
LSHIEIRQVQNRTELEQCFDLWSSVFAENETRTFFQERLDYDESYQYETTWVGKVDGVIASSVQIFPYTARLEGMTLRVGGIGNVATDFAFRGKGLAHEILHAANLWMKNNEFDLSLLFTGINSFYEQFGWRRIPEKMFHFDGQSVLKKIDLRSSEGGVEMVYLPDDLEGMLYDYNEFNQVQSNSMVRTKNYWQNQAKWKYETSKNYLVKKENGFITAYLRFRSRGSKAEILEACYLNGEEEDMFALFQAWLHRPDAKYKMSIRLPQHHVLVGVLMSAGAKEGTFQSGMWRFYDFARLMKKMEPVLQQRASGNPAFMKGKSVLLRCKEDAVFLSFDAAGEIHVDTYSGSPKYSESIEMEDTEFLSLLTQGIDSFHRPKLRENPWIHLLFPAQTGILWSADFF